ncbi:hypothetical protein D9611_006317 [Ephemerocybe angulata]|uniref:Yeast cell wall synthesis Kre9/Knh1-like N-terminal domain-containing protein n=1 Tax=Ephemerocybe angulata TaxID=980116 RepID=A0A8H5FGW6_9AGAR|nr:hypothetical protein D9611_006317 [Tulosesus angulatus]
MRFSIISFICTLLAIFTTVAVAAPILDQRDVYVPPILTPVKGTVWKKGSAQTVTWDASSPPAQITNPKGRIVLRSVEEERLILDKPLAENFDILDGQRSVTTPTDLPAGQYQIVLFGNSGNWGPVFSIVD